MPYTTTGYAGNRRGILNLRNKKKFKKQFYFVLQNYQHTTTVFYKNRRGNIEDNIKNDCFGHQRSILAPTPVCYA